MDSVVEVSGKTMKQLNNVSWSIFVVILSLPPESLLCGHTGGWLRWHSVAKNIIMLQDCNCVKTMGFARLILRKTFNIFSCNVQSQNLDLKKTWIWKIMYDKLYSDGACPHYFSGTPIPLMKNVTWPKIPEPIICWTKNRKCPKTGSLWLCQKSTEGSCCYAPQATTRWPPFRSIFYPDLMYLKGGLTRWTSHMGWDVPCLVAYYPGMSHIFSFGTSHLPQELHSWEIITFTVEDKNNKLMHLRSTGWFLPSTIEIQV